MSKISVKISAILIFFALLAVFVSGGVIYYWQTESAVTLAGDYQLADSRAKILSVDKYLSQQKESTGLLAGDEQIKNFFSNPQKYEGVIGSQLKAAATHYGKNDEISLLDLNAKIIASSEESSVGGALDLNNKNYSDTFNLAKGGEVYYSEIINNTGEEKSIFLVFLAPVFDPTHAKVVGIAERKIDFSTIEDLLIRNNPDETVHLINNAGFVLAESSSEAEQLLEKKNILKNYSSNPAWKEISTCGASETKILPSLEDPSELSLDSHIMQTGYRELRGCRWILNTERPYENLMASIRGQIIRMCFVFGLVVMLAALMVLFFIQRKITGPLTKLTKTIKGGDMSNIDIRTEKFGSDEIGQLATALKRLAEETKNYYVNLEVEVKNRTEALDKKVLEGSEQNTRLGNIKKAVLNVLEDTRDLEVAAKQERDRAQGIISSMGEGLVVVDKNYNVVMINKIAANLFEIAQEPSFGQDLKKIVSIYKKDRELLPEERPIATVLRNGEAITTRLGDNFYVKTVSGKKFPIVFTLTPIMGKGIEAVVMVFKDATEEKTLDSAKTNFISVASHQLRTPLTSIRWFTEMVLDGDAGEINEQQRHFIDRVYESSIRMSDLVNLLLQIARIESGRIIIEPEPIDLSELAKQVGDSLKPILRAKSQEVTVTSNPSPLPLVPLDKSIIWQVIQNLLTNANRYSLAKTPIQVSITQKGQELEFAVSNAGIGIPKKYYNRIFEKFFRAENAIKSVPEGSGLGLALVKSLVLGWGGKVWFESEEGKNTTFYFTIPIAGMKPQSGEVKLAV